MKKYIILTFFTLLAACSTRNYQKEYSNHLSQYKYNNISSVYAKFGTPNNIHKIDEYNYVISYKSKNYNPNSPIPGSIPGIKIKTNNMKIDTITPTLAINRFAYLNAALSEDARNDLIFDQCTTNFIIRNNQVIDYNFNGDGCGK
jgi:hypothetical protein